MHIELLVSPTHATIPPRARAVELVQEPVKVSLKNTAAEAVSDLGRVPVGVAGANEMPADYDDGLLGQAMPMFGAAYAVMFLAAAVTFCSSGPALFAVVISAGYTLMYFGVPMVMTRLKHTHDTRWTSDVRQVDAAIVNTFTGPIKRWEALLQMVLIPFAVAITFVTFCVIWSVQTV